VTPDDLLDRGIVRKGLPVKVLGRGDIDRALSVRAHAVSEAARAKIEGAGGSVELIESR
jgi:large subunit ribosomal protein L15